MMLLEQRRREDTSSVAPIECKNRESLDENYLDSSTGRKQRADSVVLDEKGSSMLDFSHVHSIHFIRIVGYIICERGAKVVFQFGLYQVFWIIKR